MRLAADVHEPARVVSALRELEVEVTIRRLPVGDYDLGGDTLVERKTISDLRTSLADGRLWRQIGELRTSLLSIADLGVTLITSRDSTDTAAWLAAIVRRRAQQPIRRRSPHVGRPSSKPHTPQIRVLAAIDGVSEARAAAPLARFGSVSNVAAAPKGDLMKTPGVHATIAQRIHDSLH